MKRPKVRSSLLHSPALGARIASGRTDTASGKVIWKPEEERVNNVIVKLARGHVAHQYSEPRLEEPAHVTVLPLALMSAEQRTSFEALPDSLGWPEIGSRAFVNLFVVGGDVHNAEVGWTILQEGRYRYAVTQPGVTVVRIVLSEFLAAEVVW